jgi:flavin reductase (DIM6/NTAB) family NADH-FMN oxidoreductase RutF
MKHFTREDLNELDPRRRANLINSVSGYKSANLIGTVSDSGVSNLAIFSSVVHIGANPPLIGFILRPAGEVPRHTYENIKQNGVYTINHVHVEFVEKAHFTSAKFDREVSEFEKCGLTEEFIEGFAAPFVKESSIKTGMRLADVIFLRLNNTILIIGEILHLMLPENTIRDDGNIDLNAVADVCISGLDTYHKVEKLKTFPYAKTSHLPEFD